jgi:hypothetical protein
MKLSVKDWLESDQDYWTGAKLYEKLGHDSGLKTLLSFGESQFTKDKLLKALQELQSIVENPKDEEEVGRYKGLPEKLYKKVVKLLKERDMLRSQLWHLPSKSDRYTVAIKIKTIQRRIQNIYRTKQDKEHVREVDYEIKGNGLELATKLMSNRAYCSRYQNNKGKAVEVNRRLQENKKIEEILKSFIYGE